MSVDDDNMSGEKDEVSNKDAEGSKKAGELSGERITRDKNEMSGRDGDVRNEDGV